MARQISTFKLQDKSVRLNGKKSVRLNGKAIVNVLMARQK